jgi:hypothetical protein
MSDNDTKNSESESHSIQKLTQALLRRIREEEASGNNRSLKTEFRELIAKEKL